MPIVRPEASVIAEEIGGGRDGVLESKGASTALPQRGRYVWPADDGRIRVLPKRAAGDRARRAARSAQGLSARLGVLPLFSQR